MLSFPIPSEYLTDTIEALHVLNIRLEAEAAALARLNTPEAKQLAQKRLEDAETAGKLFDYYLNL